MRSVLIKNAAMEVRFRPILREWVKVITRYSESHPYDALYWYNERASVSTFAAAVARRGGHVLEEFRTEKNMGREGFTGRADLWFESPADAHKSSQFLVEAKQCWLTLPAPASKLKQRAQRAMSAARASAAQLPSWDGRRLGMVFMVPAIAASRHARLPWLMEEFEAGLQELADSAQVDALAYARPKGDGPTNERNYRYPGVACLLKYLRSP